MASVYDCRSHGGSNPIAATSKLASALPTPRPSLAGPSCCLLPEGRGEAEARIPTEDPDRTGTEADPTRRRSPSQATA